MVEMLNAGIVRESTKLELQIHRTASSVNMTLLS